MRILKIRLQNLNSLRGEIEIDFTVPPLEHAGLFIIAGDTGAGKSTLLDAITLALYTCTPRKHEGEVMTHGEKECFAEVVFETAEGKFLSRWEKRRARTGTLQAAISSVFIWDIASNDWQNIGAGKDIKGSKDKKSKIEEVTGLSYEQFCKSVILPQGAFAEFLTAQQKDKAAILERLTNTEIFSVLGKAAYDKMKQSKVALEHLELQKDYQKLPTKEEIAEWKKEKAQLEKQLKEAKKTMDALQDNKTALLRLAELTEKIALVNQQQVQHQLDILAADNEQLRLQGHKKVLPFQGKIHQLEAAISESVTLESTRAELVVYLVDVTANQKTYEGFLTQAREKLKAWRDQTLQLQPLWKQVAEKDQEIVLLGAKQESKEKEWSTAKEKLEQWQQQLSTLQASEVDMQKELNTHSGWLAENGLFAQLSSDRIRIEDITTRLREHIKQRKSFQDDFDLQETTAVALEPKLLYALERKATAESNLQHIVQQIVQLLQSIDSQTDKPVEVRNALDAQIEKVGGNIKTVEALCLYQKDYRERIALLSELQEQHSHLLTEAESISQELLSLHEKLEDVIKEATLREAIWKHQAALSNYDRDRSTLTENQPCPLCGSLHHPYTHEIPLLFEDTARLDFEREKERLELLRKDQQNMTQRYKEINSKIATRKQESEVEMAEEKHLLLEKIYENEAEIAQTRLVLLSNCPEASDADLDVLQSQLEEELLQWKAQRTQYNALLDQRSLQEQEVFQATSILEQLRHEKEKVTLALQQVGARLLQHEDTNTSDLLQLNALLAPYHFHYEEAQHKNTLAALRQKQEDYEKHQKEQQSILENLNKQSGKLETLQKQIEALVQQNATLHEEKSKLDMQLAALTQERVTLFGNQDLQQVKELRQEADALLEQEESQLAEKHQNHRLESTKLHAQQKNLEHQLSDLQKKQQSLLQELTKQALSTGFADVAAFQSALLDAPTAAAIEQRLQLLDKTTIELHNQAKSLANDLAALQKLPLLYGDIHEVTAQLEAKQTDYQQQNQRLGSLAADLDNYAKLKQNMEELLQKLELRKTEYLRWQKLSSLIGAADGATFRKFAQSLTLQQLIHYANQHLEKLFGRYYLVKKSNADLDMDIIDTFQSDNQRSVNTLSGGETFLVSLALALGLSDLAGEKSNIQSLFIDEGFGALDQQTLEIAIAALENLQAQGVKIGIISHIQELKERISTKIIVEKMGNGWSRVTVGNDFNK